MLLSCSDTLVPTKHTSEKMSSADDLPTDVFPPAPAHPHTHTVIFLHGRGDNTRSFTRSLFAHSRDSRGRSLADAFPTFRWVFPQAPTRASLASSSSSATATGPRASGSGCPQWFDVWSARDYGEREEVQAEGLREVVPQIRALVVREAGELGGRFDRVVLAGISMGAATVLHVLANLAVPPEGGGRLAAVMGFCARCPFAWKGLRGMREVLGVEGAPEGDDDGVVRATPILLEHGVNDPLVKIEGARKLRDTLREFGATVEWREYPAGGHWFHDPEGMDDAVEFLERMVFRNVEGAAVAGAAAPGTIDPS